MFSRININLKRFFNNSALRRRCIIISMIATLFYLLPVNFFNLYRDMEKVSNLQGKELALVIAKTEHAMDHYPSISDIPSDYFAGMDVSSQKIVFRTYDKTVEFNTRGPEIKKHGFSDLMDDKLISIYAKIKENKIIQSRGDTTLYSYYGMPYVSFKKAFFDPATKRDVQVEIVRNLWPEYYQAIDDFCKELCIKLFYILVLSVIATGIGLRYVFNPLKKALEEGFEGVKTSNYKKRIKPNPLLGTEIAGHVANVNSILDRMQEIVDTNVQSMQDASHEVNTQLTAMKQSVDMIRMYGDGDKQMVQHRMETINASIDRAKQIMVTVIELAKLSQGATGNCEDYCLVELIEDFIAHQRRTHPSFRIEIDYDLEEPSICINREHFYLALNPIVQNAARYSFHDSNIIKIRVYQELDFVHIAVTNFGNEIDSEDIPMLFERHFRGRNYKHKSGSGLGLHIVSEVLKLYKGHVNVESKNGKTTFTLAFPAKCPIS